MFKLDPDQVYTASHWINNHDCPLTSHGAIGGAITYHFTPTGIGVVVKLSCACGKEKDLTDYNSW